MTSRTETGLSFFSFQNMNYFFLARSKTDLEGTSNERLKLHNKKTVVHFGKIRKFLVISEKLPKNCTKAKISLLIVQRHFILLEVFTKFLQSCSR